MRKIEIDLSDASFKQASDKVKAYQDELNEKAQLVVERLIKRGIRVAETSVSGSRMGTFLTFSYDVKSKSKDGVTAVMLAKKRADVISVWYRSKGFVKKHGGSQRVVAMVNPLLMEEYGSGVFAIEPVKNFLKGLAGRGTFSYPQQVYNHAKTEDFWYSATGIDSHGRPTGWVGSAGYKPTRPVLKAQLEMLLAIDEEVKEVFK